MASINGTVVLISLPAIFRGIGIDPLTSFQYLLWILFGYSIVTATLLVTFGRISDMYGRVRLYNLGFAIFTAGSILLYLTPNGGDTGALELIFFRIVQGIGAAFLFANSAAIITDAFPHNERGKALGINQVAALAGSLLGLTLGGVLAGIDWRFVFLVSVPVGLVGTGWSYLKLKELARIRKDQKLDMFGNATFGLGLTLVLIAVTYGLVPYGSATMGWGDPWVTLGLAAGVALLIAFLFIERRAADPMFRLDLFKVRMFSAANLAGVMGSIGRGGVMIMLIILLQGIWLPLHGYSYSSTPFWAGIYMLPMMAGFIVMGPVSGWLSDKYGARGFATLGMVIGALAFIALSFLPYNFDYPTFALVLFVMGIGSGMFAAPNTASIMNSVPAEHRGAASGMTTTLQNTGQTVSLALFFTVIISALASNLPSAFTTALTNAGAPQLAQAFSSIPPTGALFAAFLGYNPMASILADPRLAGVLSSIPQSATTLLEGNSFFPNAIAPAFMSALQLSFYIGAALSLAGAVASVFRGSRYIHELEQQEGRKAGEKEAVAARAPTSTASAPAPPVPGGIEALDSGERKGDPRESTSAE